MYFVTWKTIQGVNISSSEVMYVRLLNDLSKELYCVLFYA